MSLRIGFMGTPDFALEALKALVEAGHNVVCVYSQPPRKKGRGQKEQPSPVHAYADAQGIPVHTPLNFKAEEDRAVFALHELDIAVVAAYGLLLPEAILKAPKYGCINIHASLLPRWRGASPIQQAIWARDSETGVTIMQMDKGLDTGPMILKGFVPISPQTTAPVLHDALAEMGARLCLEVLQTLERDGGLEAEPQDNALTTYAPLLSREDGQIDWNKSATEIDAQVRALNPWPGTWCVHEGERLKILSGALSDHTSGAELGTVIDTAGHVACGQGSVYRIERLQPPNTKAMDFKSAVNGGYIAKYSKLSGS